ncbi:MAG: GNAT family N-acetyltransferase [Kordiimonadaceae bacterium]|nr:GNAT family N-acetyltransferase [Kordiimonadaceae bacterium]
MPGRVTVADLVLCDVTLMSRTQQLELLAIRNQETIREASYGSHIIQPEEHIAWIKKMAHVPSDEIWCFYAVLHEDIIVGGVGIRGSELKEDAVWSFYVSETEQGCGVGVALAVKALDYFFAEFALKRVCGEALVSNTGSIKYHDKLGFVEVGAKSVPIPHTGAAVEAVIFSLSAEKWQSQRAGLIG